MFLVDRNNPNIIYTAEDIGRITRIDLRSSSDTETVFNNIVHMERDRVMRATIKIICQPQYLGSDHLLLVGGAGLDVGEIDLRRIELQAESTKNYTRCFNPSFHKSAQFGPITKRKHLSSISVSGLDISKDGRTLLASYQGDQIYTFDYTSYHSWDSNTSITEGGIQPSVPRIGPASCVGGHINYDTFLKAVSFFGPRDEYIVSGCDTGAMWIWDATSGKIDGEGNHDTVRVVNVLDAGKSNGNMIVMPVHP